MPKTHRIARSLLTRAGRAERHAEKHRPLRVLEQLPQVRDVTDALEREAVLEARDQGATWEQIAAALGVTRSAVHQRHAR